MRATTKGAAGQARIAPRAAAAIESIAHSTSTSRTNCARPAPIDARSAISRALAAACADIRFARFAHAIRSTKAASTPNAASAWP